MIDVIHFTDPGCPWACSAWPALTTPRWRYGDGLRLRLVTIGLAEDRARYERDGYTPARSALGQLRFRRFGVPLSPAAKARLHATSPVVAGGVICASPAAHRDRALSAVSRRTEPSAPTGTGPRSAAFRRRRARA